jgi:hypothetical protein
MSATDAALGERAFAKLNLILHVGRRRVDGLHPLASMSASSRPTPTPSSVPVSTSRTSPRPR